MKLCRFNENRLGLIEGDVVYDVSDVLERLPAHRYPSPLGDQLIAHLGEIFAAVNDRALGKPVCRVDEARFLSPVANPTKIIAAPVNYQAHIEEAEADPQIVYNHLVARIDQAGLFLKANSSLVGPGEGIAVRFPQRRTDQEVELALVIGRACSALAPGEDPLGIVAGYAIGLDISVRGTEDRSFRKSLDSYTVLGPWLATADEIPEPARLD
jgi:2,4-didehydro-3-deoxy-L-rhamnonate hydrolase